MDKCFMKSGNFLQYYDDLNRFALTKGCTYHDAQELVSETLLAAVNYESRGGVIEHPKTWLAHTLLHKYNDAMRKKYRRPEIVNLDSCAEIATEQEMSDTDTGEEYARIRKEVNYLSRITREVIIRYYFGGAGISEIANQLSIPEGTVKSRLYAGRRQVRKGFEEMENMENNLPAKLYLTFGGSEGKNNEPVSLVENDLIAQNLLILAYEKAQSISELSRKIGIPAAYIEPVIKKLVDGELMMPVGADAAENIPSGGKYYTDFIIYRPEDSISRFDAQLKFVDKHFGQFWSVMDDMLKRIGNLAAYGKMNTRQQKKLERYAVMKALQDFQFEGTNTFSKLQFPMRRDGGHWIANANCIPAGYDENEWNKFNEYTIAGGHRSTRENCAADTCVGNARVNLQLFEFDTSFFDNPHRFTVCDDYNEYFTYIRTLLWYIYKNMPLSESDIPDTVIEKLPELEKVGLLYSDCGNISKNYTVDIPVLDGSEYAELTEIISAATGQLMKEIGNDYADFLKNGMIKIPPHLDSVPELFRYTPAVCYIVMAVVRMAHEKKLHLHDVDYCCPPVVLVYDIKE